MMVQANQKKRAAVVNRRQSLYLNFKRGSVKCSSNVDEGRAAEVYSSFQLKASRFEYDAFVLLIL